MVPSDSKGTMGLYKTYDTSQKRGTKRANLNGDIEPGVYTLIRKLIFILPPFLRKLNFSLSHDMSFSTPIMPLLP
jgi:hypothetical protein